MTASVDKAWQIQNKVIVKKKITTFYLLKWNPVVLKISLPEKSIIKQILTFCQKELTIKQNLFIL